jgi:hypothetical protein
VKGKAGGQLALSADHSASVNVLNRGVERRRMNLPSLTTPDGLFEYMMVFILLAAALGFAVIYFGG